MKTSYIQLACPFPDILLKKQVLQMRCRDKKSDLLLLSYDSNDDAREAAVD
jgi:hypothetical protein